MQDYQQRVVDEKTALDEKISKLRVFIDSEIHQNLPEKERIRLGRQLFHMRRYSEILGERIDAF